MKHISKKLRELADLSEKVDEAYSFGGKVALATKIHAQIFRLMWTDMAKILKDLKQKARTEEDFFSFFSG